jgi:hypothetical protein
MGGFKLLAIRPLVGCDEKFSKRLTPGCVYSFYQDYVFRDENGDVIDEKNGNLENSVFSVDQQKAINLFTEKKRLLINVSAIVGKNGSGKSTLFELFFLVLFLKSAETGLLDLEEERSRAQDRIDLLEKDIDILNRNIQEFLKNRAEDAVDLILNRKQLQEQLAWEKHHLERVEVSQSFAEKNTVRAEVYFGVNGKVCKLTVGEQSSSSIEELELTRGNIPHFFYSISLNYSLYGLNAKYMGRWIERLFHKNDEYRTPIVINPMRSDGDIDINKENDLAQSRILTNLVDEKLQQKEVVKGKVVDRIQFSVPTKKLDDYAYHLSRGASLFLPEKEESVLKLVKTTEDAKDYLDLPSAKDDILKLFKINDFQVRSSGLDPGLIRKYIAQKLFKIARTYAQYRKYLLDYDSNRQVIRDIETFVSDVFKDKTHKSLKLRQLINVLRYEILSEKKEDITLVLTGNDNAKEVKWKDGNFELHFADYANRINYAYRKALYENPENQIELLEFVPNGFFVPVVRFKGEDRFESLSSGEQQYYNAINTIVYHILNLDSIEKHYSRVNIMFDEVELYFHPEYQRRFISDLLNSLNNLKLDRICEVNILFSTHSPFILSDIPSSNILRLVDGKPTDQPNQTFAANIYDLLNDDFFLNEGVIGEFAKQKINDILKKKKITERDIQILDLIGDPFLKSVVLDKVRSEEYEKDDDLIKAQIEELEKQLKNKDNAAD